MIEAAVARPLPDPETPRDGCFCPYCTRLRREQLERAIIARPRPTDAVRKAVVERLRGPEGRLA